MNLFLLGVFIARALVVLGKNVPQLAGMRWLVGGVVLVVFLVPSAVRMVPAGHVGVLVLFGKVYGSIPEGVHLVNPAVTMELMSVRTKEVFEHAEAPSKEGLNVTLEVSCLYHLKASEAASVYRQVGPNYEEVVVKPQVRSAIRGIPVSHEGQDRVTP